MLTLANQGEANSVISSYNRNFTGRHDGNSATHSFVTSPELVAAFAYGGSLSYNPASDSIATESGEQFRFSRPWADDLPRSFADGLQAYQPPPTDPSTVEVAVDPNSDSLQLLQPFPEWQSGNAEDMTVLIKVKGKSSSQYHAAAAALTKG